ncbi:Chitin synthase, class 1 [Rhizoclosmatium hyalinum]|nr:Chitin synthase, class 1 [Rhizoclosmatium hyalinum]
MGIYSIQNSIKTYLDYVDPYNRVRPNVFQYMKDVPDFRNLVISILSTYVLYILSSIIHMDPWHVFTCLIQYLLAIPSFTNIIMVYAFCNIHDVSWGTKGITSASVLPAVTTAKNEKGEAVATVELPSQNQDSDEWYANSLKKLDHEAAHLHDRSDDGPKETTTDDDFFKQFRTFIVMFWFFTK